MAGSGKFCIYSIDLSVLINVGEVLDPLSHCNVLKKRLYFVKSESFCER